MNICRVIINLKKNTKSFYLIILFDCVSKHIKIACLRFWHKRITDNNNNTERKVTEDKKKKTFITTKNQTNQS